MALKKGLEIKNVNYVYVFKRQIYSHLAQKEKKSVVQFSKWIFAYFMQVVLCGPTLRVAHTFNPKNLDLSLRSESVSKSKEMFPPQLLGAD